MPLFTKTLFQELIEILEGPAGEMLTGEKRKIEAWPFEKATQPCTIAFWLTGAAEELNRKFHMIGKAFEVGPRIEDGQKPYLLLHCLSDKTSVTPKKPNRLALLL